jgi:hypothetical protein
MAIMVPNKGSSMTQTAIENFSITRHAIDPRADGGRRIVHVNARQIVIERTVQGVRMVVAVPVAAYRGLIISVRFQSATASLRLAHEDKDLDVALATGDAIDVAQKAKAWGVVFGKAIQVEEACVLVRTPFGRQRQRTKPSRRSRFARNRKIGDQARATISFAGEREIIART